MAIFFYSVRPIPPRIPWESILGFVYFQSPLCKSRPLGLEGNYGGPLQLLSVHLISSSPGILFLFLLLPGPGCGGEEMDGGGDLEVELKEDVESVAMGHG